MVGDDDQAIYASLGGVTRSANEIKDEFEIEKLSEFTLVGNYRSSQRVIEFCHQFRESDFKVESLSDLKDSNGKISFSDQRYHADDVSNEIASVVEMYIEEGIPEHEICVLAPRWRFITSLGRELVRLLPSVRFDAPGLSPFRVNQDGVWFKLVKLILTEPHPRYYRSRLQLAGDIVREVELSIGSKLDPHKRIPRNLLRLINSLDSTHTDGISYLEDITDQLFLDIKINLSNFPAFAKTRDDYFEAARKRLMNPEYSVPADVQSLRKFFRPSEGVVVNTCHGIKGEEYKVVICFGLLRGYVPHWDEIFDKDVQDSEESQKLLYVIMSRAKLYIHLIAESGRKTQRGDAYETTRELKNVEFEYDVRS